MIEVLHSEALAGQVAGAPAPVFWALVAAAVAASIGGFYSAFRALRRRRLIEDTPTARIKSAPQGYVILHGRGALMPGQPIIAPLSGTRCTWYRYRVEHREMRGHDGKHRNQWRTVKRGTSDELFHLEDETGCCVVDPEGAQVIASEKDTWFGATPNPGSGPGSETGAGSFTGDYRYSEERLLPDQPLFALGRFRTVGGAGDLGDARSDLTSLLRDWKRDLVTMQRFDANGDGRIDAGEWESARRAANTEVVQARARRAASAGTDMLTKPLDPRRPFLLSALPPERLIGRYRWLTLGGVALFFVAGIATTWMLVIRLGS